MIRGPGSGILDELGSMENNGTTIGATCCGFNPDLWHFLYGVYLFTL